MRLLFIAQGVLIATVLIDANPEILHQFGQQNIRPIRLAMQGK